MVISKYQDELKLEASLKNSFQPNEFGLTQKTEVAELGLLHYQGVKKKTPKYKSHLHLISQPHPIT